MADVRDEAVAAEGSSLKVVMIASVAAVGGFLFGYDTAVINGAVGALEATFQAGDTPFPVRPGENPGGTESTWAPSKSDLAAACCAQVGPALRETAEAMVATM